MRTFGFDLGTGSIAGAIAEDQKITHLDSFVFPEDWGAMARPRKRRAAARIRKAHRAREYHWWRCAKDAGIPVPFDYEPDSIEKKEYRIRILGGKEAAKAYARFKSQSPPSVLLRIKLLEGESLDGEDVFKAIHHAIQRRGYKECVPWGGRSDDDGSGKGVTEEKEKEREAWEKKKRDTKEAEKCFKKDFGDSFCLPCYIEAQAMGLWVSPSEGLNDDFSKVKSPKVRNKFVFSRDLVIREVQILLKCAKVLFPKLNVEKVLGHMADHIKSERFASRTDLRFYQGHQSILGQKWPRFENRSVRNCRVFHRLKSAKRQCDEFKEFYYLDSFMRLQVATAGGLLTKLHARDVDGLYKAFKEDIQAGQGLGQKVLREALKALGYVYFGKQKIEEFNSKGRCAFSKVALRYLNCILRGEFAPSEAYDRILNEPCARGSAVSVRQNKTPLKGLVNEDLAIFKILKDQKVEYQNFYIPQVKTAETPEDLIRSVSSPSLRLRLELFYRLLKDFKNRIPSERVDRVVIEIVREKNSRLYSKDYEGYQRSNQEVKKEAKKKLRHLNLTVSAKNILKMRLLIEQGFVCVYTGQRLAETDFDRLEIDHILPQSQGGNSKTLNLVVTSQAVNKTHKGEKSPYQWFGQDEKKWSEFTKRVRQFYGGKGKGRISKQNYSKKMANLCSPEPKEYALEKGSLQATGYFAKLAHRLAYLVMGWTMPSDAHSDYVERKVWVVPGAVTAMVGHRLGRHEFLTGEDPKNRKQKKKDTTKKANSAKSDMERENPKHHAFDAAVCALIPQFWGWAQAHGGGRDGLFEKLLPPPNGFAPEKQIGEVFFKHLPVKKIKAPAISEQVLSPSKIYDASLVSGGEQRKNGLTAREETFEIPPQISGEVTLRGSQHVDGSKGSNRGYAVLETTAKKPSKRYPKAIKYELVKWRSFESYETFLAKISKRLAEGRGRLVIPYLIRTGDWLDVKPLNRDLGLEGIYRIETIQNEGTFLLRDMSGKIVRPTRNVNPLFGGAQIELVIPKSVFSKKPRRIFLIGGLTNKDARLTD